MECVEDEDALLVESALRTPGPQRHSGHLNSIVSFLVDRSNFKECIRECMYPEAIMKLAQAAYLTTVEEKDFITREGVALGCCHVLFRGVVSLEHSGEAAALDRNVKPGGSVGLMEIVRDEAHWSSSARIMTAGHAAFLSLSRQVVLQVIGNRSGLIEDDARFFWRFHDLWRVCSPEVMVHPSFKCLGAPSSSSLSPKESKEEDAELARLKGWALGTHDMSIKEVQALAARDETRHMDVVASARLLTFAGGTSIVAQGVPRRYLYIVKTGECSVTRAVLMDDSDTEDASSSSPSAAAASPPTPTELDLGLTLYAGDFFFMDGEIGEWLPMSQLVLDDKQPWLPGEAVPPLAELAQRRKELLKNRRVKRPRKNIFEQHRHSLVARTRVQVVAVPLEKVAMHSAAFKRLLEVAAARFPVLRVEDEDVVQALRRVEG